MSSKEQRFTKKRVRTSYASVVVSMTLVLFVLGLLGVLLLSTNALSESVRENFTFTLVLEADAPETQQRTLLKAQQLAPYTKRAVWVDKEVAAEQLRSELGEDFLGFLGYNPLSNTIDLNLKADFVAQGDLEALKTELLAHPEVADVLYDPDLIGLVNENIEKIGYLLGGASALLLIVALALINSSIKLTIYSKRFLLKTMQLVGATSSFIRRPYLITGIWLGLSSTALGALLMMATGKVILWYFPQMSVLLDLKTILIVLGGMLGLGLLVPGVSTAVAIRKYLKLRTNELYY